MCLLPSLSSVMYIVCACPYLYQTCIQLLCIPCMQGGKNALHLAARGGHVSTIRYLVPRIESLLHSTDTEGYTVLHWAAQQGHTEVVRVVVDDYNLDPTARDKVRLMCAPNH